MNTDSRCYALLGSEVFVKGQTKYYKTFPLTPMVLGSQKLEAYSYVFVRLADGAEPVVGLDLYVSIIGSKTYIGKALSEKMINPEGLPPGNWVKVSICTESAF